MSYVLVLAVVPVTVTPLKLTAMRANRAEPGSRVDSRWRPLARISPSMSRAVIASEDNNFLKHHGFDWKAISQAMDYNRTHDRIRGASTISQQTAKNVFCLPDRTWVRKGFETYFTVLVELLWGKERIMEVYLNVIETHPDVYGAESAARRFFDKPASQLDAFDASMIACVLPSPRRMDIARPSAYMQNRAATIRRLMRQLPEGSYGFAKQDTR